MSTIARLIVDPPAEPTDPAGLASADNTSAGPYLEAAASQQLADELAKIRKLLPTPLETVRQPDPAALERLTLKIAAARDRQALQQLAAGLTSREIALLFPLLASPATPARLNGRVTRLILASARPTLYRYGWLSLQYHYPQAEIARALSELCSVLTPSVRRSAVQISLDARAAPPLISQIIAPDSRAFVRNLVERLVRIGLSMDAFIRDYAVEPDSPLGREIIAAWFLAEEAPAFVIRQSGPYFVQALTQATPDRQATLISRFLNRTDIEPDERNAFCQLIYRQFGSPLPVATRFVPSSGIIEPTRDIWARLPARDIKAFQDWTNAATIGSHCARWPAKARLYLDFAAPIKRLEFWDKDTLLIYWPGFVVADTRDQEMALYYSLDDQPEPSPARTLTAARRKATASCRNPAPSGETFIPAGPTYAANPASRLLPHRPIGDAIRYANFQGTIGLSFDPQGCQLTRVFLSMRLRQNTVEPR